METRVQAVIEKIAPIYPLPPVLSHRRQYRLWTAEERAMLAMMWATTMPTAEIAGVLDRSETSCQMQASMMGVKRPIQRPHRKKDWTRAEDTMLIEARAAKVPYTKIIIGDRTPAQMKNRYGYMLMEGWVK
jgi:hypothetical protein